MKKIIIICFVFAIIGLFLSYFSEPEQIFSDFEKCEGKVKTQGTLIKTFFSKNGNNIGILKTINGKTVFIALDYSFSKGDELRVYANAENFSGQCWLFPEVVENA